ncbi:MAG: hypothetical protein Ta2G_04500 [Termitinemataceae bacterium]|nr:MAG: hypothetical protein Ta2G_04500 [Termitinemataceae bacterium]
MFFVNRYCISFFLVAFCVFSSTCKSQAYKPPTNNNSIYTPLTFSLLKSIEMQAIREGKQIEDVKFFLSDDVELNRNKNDVILHIETNNFLDKDKNGTIYRANQRNTERIIIERDLTGFYVEERNKPIKQNGSIILGISFDPNNKNNLLYFSQSEEKPDDFFYVHPIDVNESAPRVNYGGNNYFLKIRNKEAPYLMVKIVDITENILYDNVTILEGLKVKPDKGER